MPIFPESSSGPVDRTLRIGRVVLPNASFELERTTEGITLVGMVETGWDQPGNFATATAWALDVRDDLKGHEKEQDLIAVTWDGSYEDVTGFYYLTESSFQTKTGYGNFGFTVALREAVRGSSSPNDILFRTQWVGRPPNGAITNDFSITSAAVPSIAPPGGHEAFDPGATIPSSFTRELANGDEIRIYTDVALDSLGRGEAVWSVDAWDFYSGAVSVERLE